MIIALLLALIMKRTNDNKVSQPQQTQEVVSKKEDTETNLPKVTKVDQSKEPYENTITVSDLDSIYILVNKYSGLPEDYEPKDLVEVPSRKCECAYA